MPAPHNPNTAPGTRAAAAKATQRRHDAMVAELRAAGHQITTPADRNATTDTRWRLYQECQAAADAYFEHPESAALQRASLAAYRAYHATIPWTVSIGDRSTLVVGVDDAVAVVNAYAKMVDDPDRYSGNDLNAGNDSDHYATVALNVENSLGRPWGAVIGGVRVTARRIVAP